MPASQSRMSRTTPMGATLIPAGATSRPCAPEAREVHVLGEFNAWKRDDKSLLVKQEGGRWAGFFADVTDGMTYNFYVVGEGSEGLKRDPYSRELTVEWPNPKCILRRANSYPWQDWSWRTPAFSDLIIYQLHIATFYGPNREERVD